jgi:hypothetical protein
MKAKRVPTLNEKKCPNRALFAPKVAIGRDLRCQWVQLASTLSLQLLRSSTVAGGERMELKPPVGRPRGHRHPAFLAPLRGCAFHGAYSPPGTNPHAAPNLCAPGPAITSRRGVPQGTPWKNCPSIAQWNESTCSFNPMASLNPIANRYKSYS